MPNKAGSHQVSPKSLGRGKGYGSLPLFLSTAHDHPEGNEARPATLHPTSSIKSTQDTNFHVVAANLAVGPVPYTCPTAWAYPTGTWLRHHPCRASVGLQPNASVVYKLL